MNPYLFLMPRCMNHPTALGIFRDPLASSGLSFRSQWIRFLNTVVKNSRTSSSYNNKTLPTLWCLSINLIVSYIISATGDIVLYSTVTLCPFNWWHLNGNWAQGTQPLSEPLLHFVAFIILRRLIQNIMRLLYIKRQQSTERLARVCVYWGELPTWDLTVLWLYPCSVIVFFH